MTQAEHEKRLRKIEVETEEIKRQTEKIKSQIMPFEFQHKKDVAEAERRFDEQQKALAARQGHSQKQIDHLIKLVGLTYHELDEIDATLTETGVVL